MRNPINLFRSSRAALALLLIAGILLAISFPIFAGGPPRRSQQQISQERYLECTEVSGDVTYYKNGFLKQVQRQAKVGDRISRPGEGIRTGVNSSANLATDNGIANSRMSQNSNVSIKNLGRQSNGATTTELRMNQGQLRSKVRSFTNPQSNFKIQTPTGVAGVRGTDFIVIVKPNGETQVITVEGLVAVSGGTGNQQVTEVVGAGNYTIVKPGNPPTKPTPFNGDARVSLEVLPAPETGKVRVSGVVNPINSVFLEGQSLPISPTGEFETVVSFPPQGILKLLVRTPLGDEQVYELKFPQ
ncbi:FecR domain-containing protein [Phormidium sp. LEGE 05292]|uniref:FecR family protein n=1 Tax=[Phormidium] sp. LEGE 05292 TaxID=767427 RepID=UPI0018820C73|nr:FecR family protein [Phormidium sp. LEGE 05292]MBE9225039.1 FecR domain-containing protein [Phormidium sp. LEGE 05292]